MNLFIEYSGKEWPGGIGSVVGSVEGLGEKSSRLSVVFGWMDGMADTDAPIQ